MGTVFYLVVSLFGLADYYVAICFVELHFVSRFYSQDLCYLRRDSQAQGITDSDKGPLESYGHTSYSVTLHLYVERYTLYSVCIAMSLTGAPIGDSILLRVAKKTLVSLGF